MSHKESLEFFKFIIDKITKEYEDWLENRAAMGSVLSSPRTEAGSPSTEGKGTAESGLGREGDRVVTTDRSQSPPNIANKAQEIREKARTSIKEYMRTREKTMSSDATTGLLNLANDWGPGGSVYKALDLIPDIDLCKWNDKHKVFL